MLEKRMLIINADVVRKVDENRGDMNHSDFINFLIDSRLEEDSGTPKYITEEKFEEFQQGTRELLRNFLEFFVSFGLELGKQPNDETFVELTQTLQALSDSGKKAKNL